MLARAFYLLFSEVDKKVIPLNLPARKVALLDYRQLVLPNKGRTNKNWPNMATTFLPEKHPANVT